MKYNHWTNKEIVLLRKMFPTTTKTEICALLPRHPYRSIMRTSATLKIRKDVNPESYQLYWIKLAHLYFEARKKSHLLGGFKIQDGGAPGVDTPPPATPDYERKSE